MQVADYRRPLKPHVQPTKLADLKHGDVVWLMGKWVKVDRIFLRPWMCRGSVWYKGKHGDDWVVGGIMRVTTLYRRTDHALS